MLMALAQSGRLYVRAATVAGAKGLKTQPEARLGLAYFGAILSPMSVSAAHFSARTLNLMEVSGTQLSYDFCLDGSLPSSVLFILR